MINNILLIPGLNGKFDSLIFEEGRNWAKEKKISIEELKFSKYNKEKLESTFNEQKEEILKKIKGKEENSIIVAKSLGCIPTLLIKNNMPKILISPPIKFGKEEGVFNKKFKDLDTKPVTLNSIEKEEKVSIMYGDQDERISLEDLENSRYSRKMKIIHEDHNMNSKESREALRKELDYYYARDEKD